MKIKVLKESDDTFSMSRKAGAADTMPISRNNTAVDEPDPDRKAEEEALAAYAKRNSNPIVHLSNAGFENVDFIGRGMFGYVYSADHPSGREMAVKAVQKDNDGHDREIRAYKTIGQARGKSKQIAKHFPLIYTVDTDSHDQFSFIAMERLTDEGPYADILDDIFMGPEAMAPPRTDLIARGAWKDLSRRIKLYFNNDEAREKIIDKVFEGTPDDFIEEIKIWSRSWQSWRTIMPRSDEDYSGFDRTPSELAKKFTTRLVAMTKSGKASGARTAYENRDFAPLIKAMRSGYYYDALQIMQKEMKRLQAAPQQGQRYARDRALYDFYKRTYSRFYNTGVWLDQMIDEYVLYNDRDALQDEFGGLKKEFEEEPWMAYFVLGALKKLKEYRPTETDPVWQDTKKGEPVEDYYWRWSTSIVNGWVNFIRQGAPIGIFHKPEPERQDRGGVEDEIGDSFEEVKSIKKALDELERITGLAARDMHDKNVMMRPLDGSIVIVDVGMFKPRSEIKSRFQRAVNESKIELQERFYNEAVDFDFDFDDFSPKTALHPSFWQEKKLFDQISAKLKSIAQEFAEEIGIADKLEDIWFVGSLASFNWHKKSDIDLHLVVDFAKINKDEDMVEEMMRLQRMRWNDDHNIRFYGHEVEIYVQDVDHKGSYAGIYSLKTDKWLEEPKKENPSIDFSAISTKAASLASEINEIYSLYRKNYVEEAHQQAEGMKKKIREMRQAGLDGEGTYSVENLTFKLLRNNGFLRKLSNIRDNSYDIMMSVGQKPIITLNISNNLEEKRKKRKKKRKSKVTYSRNPRSKGGYTGKTHWHVGSWWYNGTSDASSGDAGGDGGGGE